MLFVTSSGFGHTCSSTCHKIMGNKLPLQIQPYNDNNLELILEAILRTFLLHLSDGNSQVSSGDLSISTSDRLQNGIMDECELILYHSIEMNTFIEIEITLKENLTLNSTREIMGNRDVFSVSYCKQQKLTSQYII